MQLWLLIFVFICRHTVGTYAGVLGAFLRDHDGLVLLAVELQQTILVTELFHLCPPHHRLCQVTLNLTTVAPRRLVARNGTVSHPPLNIWSVLKNDAEVKKIPCRTSRGTSWHKSRCRSRESCLRTVAWRSSYRAGYSGYSLHTSDPTSW